MYMNKVTELEFIDGVSSDFNEKIANELNARCNMFVEADEARGVVMYAVEDFDNEDVAREQMHAACDILVESYGLNMK